MDCVNMERSQVGMKCHIDDTGISTVPFLVKAFEKETKMSGWFVKF
jgi:hypothetical protein